MTRLSHLRSRLFAHKLTSSISDNFIGSDQINVLLTQARLGYETMLSQTSGERVDQRRSAMKWQVTYRQWVVAPAAVVLVLDINSNRQYHKKLLQQINQIINHTITSCEQLWLECVILYSDQQWIQEYTVESLDESIYIINQSLQQQSYQTDTLLPSYLDRYYNEYYDHHGIVLSDWYARDPERDAHRSDNQLASGQMIWYIRDYPSPIVHRWAIPEGLIQLKR